MGFSIFSLSLPERSSRLRPHLSAATIRRDTARRWTYREPYAVALILLGLNQTQEAVKWLEQSYREGSLWSFGFQSDPILAQLCNDPYYRQFLSKASYSVPENVDQRKAVAD